LVLNAQNSELNRRQRFIDSIKQFCKLCVSEKNGVNILINKQLPKEEIFPNPTSAAQ
jgi:hypothetical protein